MVIRGKIKEQHMDRGAHKARTGCPLYLSLVEKGYTEVVVTSKVVKVVDRNEDEWLGPLPPDVEDGVNRFDRHQAVEPIAYRLELD